MSDTSDSRPGGPPPPPRRRTHWRLTWRMTFLGALAGLAYGIVMRILIAQDGRQGIDAWMAQQGTMTLTYIAVVPLVMGWLTLRWHPSPRPAACILLPWLPVTACLLLALIVGWEGSICLVMAAPITLFMGSFGGCMGAIKSLRELRSANGLMLVPLLTMPIEARWTPEAQVREVVVERTVDAPPAVVWRQVVQVPAIQPHEQRPALFTVIGFPRAVSATLAREEVGAIRHARFEGGLLFLETVIELEPEHRLAFTLDAQMDLIPPTTLDQHVTIGGPFFDTLDGRYELTALDGGRTHVRLSSRHRLSTRFNLYSGLWSDAIMRSIQANILEVVASRCEGG